MPPSFQMARTSGKNKMSLVATMCIVSPFLNPRFLKTMDILESIEVCLKANSIFNMKTLSTNLYVSPWFQAKDAAELRWLHRPLQFWLLLKLELKEVLVTLFYFFIIYTFTFEIWSQSWWASMHGERNKYMTVSTIWFEWLWKVVK